MLRWVKINHHLYTTFVFQGLNINGTPKDGANVDGSCILALPTDEPFEGGALHVWDGKPKQVTFFFLRLWVLLMVRC